MTKTVIIKSEWPEITLHATGFKDIGGGSANIQGDGGSAGITGDAGSEGIQARRQGVIKPKDNTWPTRIDPYEWLQAKTTVVAPVKLKPLIPSQASTIDGGSVIITTSPIETAIITAKIGDGGSAGIQGSDPYEWIHPHDCIRSSQARKFQPTALTQ